MRFITGECGSGKTHYILSKYPEAYITNCDNKEEVKTAFQIASTGTTVLANIFFRYQIPKEIKYYEKYPIFLEFHTKVFIPAELKRFVILIKADREEIKKFCGISFKDWTRAVNYKKYGIIEEFPKEHSELYYIKLLSFRYAKFRRWLKYL